jgi:hypothetical protein
MSQKTDRWSMSCNQRSSLWFPTAYGEGLVAGDEVLLRQLSPGQKTEEGQRGRTEPFI